MGQNQEYDERIQSLAAEVEAMRLRRNESGDPIAGLTAKVTEALLNLAMQDRTLGKLDTAINGNGKPGLRREVDELNRTSRTLVRLTWLIIGAMATLGVDRAIATFHGETQTTHQQTIHP